MNGKLFLIDGHALVFKMYYAFLRRPMINSKGVDTSILFGFTKYLLEMVERENPTHLAVAFDPPGGTFRNQLYPEYKANRAETPQLVIDALEPLMQICSALNIPVLMESGFEADDVIGSMARRSAEEDLDVYMVTPDKDYGQLIAPHIFQYKPGKSGSDNEIIDSAAICAKYGISKPVQVIDMLTLCGDTADNVPGVKGVGEVGAGKLVAKYGSVESIYEHLGELSAKQQAMFEAARDHIALSKELVTIKTDIPLATTKEDMLLDNAYKPEIADIFEKYEFNSLKRFISHIRTETERPEEDFVYEEIDCKRAISEAKASGLCSFLVEAEGEGIYAPVRSLIVATSAGRSFHCARGGAEQFKELLSDASVAKAGYGIKLQLNRLANCGICLEGRLLDIELMHYLINPERSHSLDILTSTYLNQPLQLQSEGSDSVPATLFDAVEPEDAGGNDRFRECALMLALAPKLEAEMTAASLTKLYDEIEEPLIAVLGRMERNGVKLDIASLASFADRLREEVKMHEAEVRRIADEAALNVASPKQVGEVLFEKMKLDPKAKKSKGGNWSTDEETLLSIADRSPIVNEILEYRAAKKLLSTYIEPFPGYISARDGRIHTTFNQALTSTGRLSSSNPNLQNIPIRTERGKEIRRAFVASDADSVIMSADYSQIELRIMAHLSCDSHLIHAFREGQDVHAATASKIFSVPIGEVSPEQRRVAKTANFGIMYGISTFGLAQRLRCSRKEAGKIIDDYFNSFPAIRIFIDNTLESARECGYVETLFGRRRYVPDITSHNATVRANAERNAVNAPIQGTSADIIKLAMIAIDRRMAAEGMKSRMVLQIHDELLFEVRKDELERMQALVVQEMEHVLELSIPLTVECNYGTNWLESH